MCIIRPLRFIAKTLKSRQSQWKKICGLIFMSKSLNTITIYSVIIFNIYFLRFFAIFAMENIAKYCQRMENPKNVQKNIFKIYRHKLKIIFLVMRR